MSSTLSPQSIPKGTRVLVVDDHDDTVHFLSKLLQKAGCHVTTATGVRDAQAHLKAHTFDLIISDLGLADGSGTDVMRQARTLQATKGIALSGFDSADQRKQSEEAGFCEHLAKPVDVNKLLQAMQRALGA